MIKLPKTLSSKSVYSNKFLDVKVDTLELNGRQWEQAYFVKPNKDAAVVIPLDENGLYLLYQYRYASQQFLWQLPAGMIDPSKTVEETAAIELEEEAGFKADKLVKIGSVIAEPGMSPQESFVFVAKGLQKTKTDLAETEIGMNLKHFSFVQIKEMIKKGEIKCGFTLSALLLLKNNYQNF